MLEYVCETLRNPMQDEVWPDFAMAVLHARLLTLLYISELGESSAFRESRQRNRPKVF